MNNAPHNAPTVLVIFGATGDLMRRKLVPALFRLYQRGYLPDRMQVVGFSRSNIGDAGLRDMVGQMLHDDAEGRDGFLERMSYVSGDFEDASSYSAIAAQLDAIDKKWGTCSNKLFYLAVPPRYYRSILQRLSDSGLTEPCGGELGWTRVLVEKPFGDNLSAAQKLDDMLGRLFDERQIFRIDHYLAKEAVQNILALRFSNAIFESAWDNQTIEKVEVRLLEELGVEGRGSFYDEMGALRDVGQNHLLQMLSLIAMDRPSRFNPDAIRRSRAQLLGQLQPITSEELEAQAVRGQYVGYRDEPGVAADSDTETYFRLRAHIENERWRGIPFFLEAGKRMQSSIVDIAVTFRHREPCICPSDDHYRNVLYFQLQPNSEIVVSFYAKKPGLALKLEEKSLVFNYQHAFGGDEFTDAYQKILLDCIGGDQTLFASTDEVRASWKFVDPIIEAWRSGAAPLMEYEPGSGGPAVER